METSIRIELDGIRSVEQQLQRLQGPELSRALFQALNKVGAKTQTQADRAIRERFNIGRDQVRGSFVFVRARHNGHVPEAVLRIFGSPTKRGRSMNVVRFMERRVTLAEARRRVRKGTQRQLRFKILRRGGGLKTIDGAFLGNQGRTVFRRVGSARLPIEPVQVVGVSQMFNTRVIRERVIGTLRKEYEVEVRRAVDLAIRRRGA